MRAGSRMLSRAREIVAKLIERQLAGRLVRQLYLVFSGVSRIQ